MKRILFLMAAFACIQMGMACTNFLVGKGASTDGSVFITYNADSYGMFGRLIYLPHAKHQPGEMREIYDGDTNHYYGKIPEAPETYAVMGYINEYQLSIMETTFGGREELVDPEGKIDYVSLMRLGLQRAKTAREAIKVMTDLVAEYGYASEGESFSIADPNEAWIMEMVGRGPAERGANWVAVRIPDDCVACHANHSRIRKLSSYKDTEVIMSKGLIDFARKHGFFSGADADFDFSAAFAPADFGAIRYCETRVWSFYNRFVEGMDKYLKYADGRHMNEPDVEPMPLYMKPKRKLTLADMRDGMRDHYEGTPFDVQKDCGMGPGEMPYRPTPLEYEYNGRKYFNERPISTQQTADTYIAQLRSWMPDCVGGVLWYGQDDPNMIVYVPIYCQNTSVPECFDAPDADATHFSEKSAFWVCNWVSNMVYPRYNVLFPELLKERNSLEGLFGLYQTHIEEDALSIFKKKSAEEARRYLTAYSNGCAEKMHEKWLALARRLIVRYNDMTIKPVDEKGEYVMTEDGLPVAPKRPGYPESYRRKIVEETGDHYLLEEK